MKLIQEKLHSFELADGKPDPFLPNHFFKESFKPTFFQCGQINVYTIFMLPCFFKDRTM